MARTRKLDWESIIDDADFTAQTPNGTAKWKGTGWNDQYGAPYERPEVKPTKTRPAGRSNRTGE